MEQVENITKISNKLYNKVLCSNFNNALPYEENETTETLTNQ